MVTPCGYLFSKEAILQNLLAQVSTFCSALIKLSLRVRVAAGVRGGSSCSTSQHRWGQGPLCPWLQPGFDGLAQAREPTACTDCTPTGHLHAQKKTLKKKLAAWEAEQEALAKKVGVVARQG